MRRLPAIGTTLIALVTLSACYATGSGSTAASAGTSAAGTSSLTLDTGDTSAGTTLVGPNGMTLYIFTVDTGGTSSCSGDCAATWPPLTVDAGAALSGGSGVTGTFGTTTRDDGTVQVTYNDQPLYYYAPDSAPGDATGEGVNGVWFIAKPDAGSGAVPSSPANAAPSEYEY